MQFLVLGMHRSGTSALARVLGLMGCHVGSDDELAPGDRANPKGYWERKDVWALDERMLQDIGLNRSAVPFAVTGFAQGKAIDLYADVGVGITANDNTGLRHAA